MFTIIPTNRLFISDKNILSRLGKYTYGLYIFHTIIIALFLQIQKNTIFEGNNLVTSVASFVITVIVSTASYHLFEKQFLKLKIYFIVRLFSLKFCLILF